MSNEIIIGAFFFILGLIPAYYFYVKSLRNKEIVYAVTNNKIMQDFNSTIPNLKVSYGNKKIKSFSVARIAFYNRGSETITKQDLDTVNHLRIIANKTVKILDASVVQTNNSSNLFSVELIDNQAIINFDYLDKDNGAVVTVMHTGLSRDDIEIVGDVKGAKSLVDIARIPKFESKFEEILASRKVMKFIYYSFFITIALVIGVVLFMMFYPDKAFNVLDFETPKSFTLFLYSNIGFVIFFLVWLYGFNIVFRPVFGFRKLPIGLESFDERIINS